MTYTHIHTLPEDPTAFEQAAQTIERGIFYLNECHSRIILFGDTFNTISSAAA